MFDVATTLLVGAVFGLALAAPPGPMNAVIAEESALRGWTAGVAAGLGAFTADVCFFALALFGAVRVVATRPTLRAIMVGAGGLLMLYFAYEAATGTGSFTGDERAGAGRGFAKALALALTNPYQIVFWLTVGVGLLRPGRVDVLSRLPAVGDAAAGLLVVRTGSPALVVGLFLGVLVWVVGFPAGLVALGRRVDAFAPTVAAGSAVVLALFGVWFLTEAAAALG